MLARHQTRTRKSSPWVITDRPAAGNSTIAAEDVAVSSLWWIGEKLCSPGRRSDRRRSVKHMQRQPSCVERFAGEFCIFWTDMSLNKQTNKQNCAASWPARLLDEVNADFFVGHFNSSVCNLIYFKKKKKEKKKWHFRLFVLPSQNSLSECWLAEKSMVLE